MTRSRCSLGFTLIEIMISVFLIGLLTSIAIPNFIRSRTSAQTNVCIKNLRTIDEAIQQWALELKKGANAPVELSDISAYMRNSVICPAGGASFADSYSISVVGAEPNCQRYPGSHLIAQLGSGTSDPSSTSPSSHGQPSHGNNGNGNANGHANGNSGNGNGNAP